MQNPLVGSSGVLHLHRIVRGSTPSVIYTNLLNTWITPCYGTGFKRDTIISATNHGETELHYSTYSCGYHGRAWALTVAGDGNWPPLSHYQRVPNTMQISWPLLSESKNRMVELRDENEYILTYLSCTMTDCDRTFELVDSCFVCESIRSCLVCILYMRFFASIWWPLRWLLLTSAVYLNLRVESVNNDNTFISYIDDRYEPQRLSQLSAIINTHFKCFIILSLILVSLIVNCLWYLEDR